MAITPQHVTVTTKRVVHFMLRVYSTLRCQQLDFENMREYVRFPLEPVTHIYIYMYVHVSVVVQKV